MTSVEIWILSLVTIIIGVLVLFGITVFIAYLIDLIKGE